MRSSFLNDSPSSKLSLMSCSSSSNHPSAFGVCSTTLSLSNLSPRPATALSREVISDSKSSAMSFSQEPITTHAVDWRFSFSRSSAVSSSTVFLAAITSPSLATSSSMSPSLQRRHDSANVTGPLRSRLPMLSMANVPPMRRRFSPDAMSLRIWSRNSSRAVMSASSLLSNSILRALGSRRWQNLGGSPNSRQRLCPSPFRFPDEHALRRLG